MHDGLSNEAPSLPLTYALKISSRPGVTVNDVESGIFIVKGGDKNAIVLSTVKI